jgi:hypothetical protein
LAGIRQVRASGGRYHGLKLALAAALAYPLALLDCLVVFVTVFVLFPGPGPVASRVAMLMCIATVALDVWIVRRIWRRVSRAPDARPGRPEPFGRPARHVQPSSRAYSLRPKRRFVGALIVLGVGFLLLLVAILFLLVEARRQRQMAMQARAEAMEMRARDEASHSGQAVVRPDIPADRGGLADARTFRFKVHAPIDTKTTLWAELWIGGKLQSAPGFEATQWVVPPPRQPFDGTATFGIEPGHGKVMAGWRISGNAGSIGSEQPVPDPFAGMTVRDSTWGGWTGALVGLAE